MTLIILNLFVVLIGLALTPVLYHKFPRLFRINEKHENISKVSIIIPARNEEENISLLLKDLQKQSIQPLEIICVDDDSSDETARIAESFGVKVLSLHNKPEGWTGKTWACQNGANIAKGELLLFLDADIRLGENGLERIIKTYSDSNTTLSVQPFHNTEKFYEQFSIMFNLIQIAANGTSLKNQDAIGLYGPIILISKSNYDMIGGHESVRTSIVEDIALGQRLKNTNIPHNLFIGDEEISFRMYSGGLRSLFQGWVKNIATGANSIPKSLFCMVFIWISSIASVPIHMLAFVIKKNLLLFMISFFLYIVWTIILYFLSKKIGKYNI